MPTEQSTLTRKFQATIPKNARNALMLRHGQMVRWHIQKTMVVVSAQKKIDDPLKRMFSQVKKRITVDAVNLIREVREEIV